VLARLGSQAGKGALTLLGRFAPFVEFKQFKQFEQFAKSVRAAPPQMKTKHVNSVACSRGVAALTWRASVRFGSLSPISVSTIASCILHGRDAESTP